MITPTDSPLLAYKFPSCLKHRYALSILTHIRYYHSLRSKILSSLNSLPNYIKLVIAVSVGVGTASTGLSATGAGLITIMMKSTLSTKGIAVSLAFLVCCAAIVSVNASDPDPLLDNPGKGNEFMLKDIFTNGAVSHGPGGIRAALNISILPALINEGITFVQFKMDPCGENLPHTHPRATEILTLVSGGPLQAGLVDTSGVAHIYILYPGDVIVFPRGLLHFEFNVGTETAFYISALNSQNPGVLTAGGALVALPTRALAGSLNQDPDIAEKLKREIYTYSDKLQKDTNSGCVPGQGITTEY